MESALSHWSQPLQLESAWSQQLRSLHAGASWSGVESADPARSGSLRLAPQRSERSCVGAGFGLLVMWALRSIRRPATLGAEMGCSGSRPGDAVTKRDIEKTAELAAGAAVDAVLAAGEQLPVVGGLIGLLAKAKDKYSELAELSEETEAVAVWATQTQSLLVPLQARLSSPGANTPLDDTMRVLVAAAAKALGRLLSVAEHITQGSKPASFVRGALFKADLEAAQAAVKAAMEALGVAVAIDTNVTVHVVDEKVDQIMAMLQAQIDAKETASADEKRSLKGLVGSLARQPTMVGVVTHVVGGDGAAAAAALAAKPADVRASAGARFAEGAALEAEGKYDEAVVAYRAAVEADPEMSGAWFSLGYAEYRKAGEKMSEASLEAYERCVALDPTHASAHSNLGVALEDVRKDYDGAEELWRKAIALNPTDAKAHYNLGNLLQTVRKDYDGAEELYRKAIALDPANALAHMNLAILLKTVRKDYDGAEELYRKAIALAPTNATAHSNLGKLLIEVRKDYDGAEEHFRKAIALAPDFPNAHYSLSLILEEQRGDLDGAIREMREFVRCGGIPGWSNGEARLAGLIAKQK